MEELGWHKPLLQIQRAGKTAFFPPCLSPFPPFFLAVVLKNCILKLYLDTQFLTYISVCIKYPLGVSICLYREMDM